VVKGKKQDYGDEGGGMKDLEVQPEVKFTYQEGQATKI